MGLPGMSLQEYKPTGGASHIWAICLDLLGQGPQHKLPFGNSNVWYYEPFIFYLLIVIQKYVEVNISRPLLYKFTAT